MMMSRRGGNYREPVKVVIINTQYIETDPMSFKSVVQRLTGKDSTINTNHLKPRPPQLQQQPVFATDYGTSQNAGDKSGASNTGNSVMSFEELDLDRLILTELPSLDELYQLYKMDD